jgi:uncharacterized protein (TIGR03435 family)
MENARVMLGEGEHLTTGQNSRLVVYLRASLFLVAAVGASITPFASGQATQSTPAQAGNAAATPTFDVAAIRINKTDKTGHSHIVSSPSDTHFKTVNVSAKALIRYAFQIPEDRIEGGPGWLASEKFDIDAKSDAAADEQIRKIGSDAARVQKQKMLQALLADRFGLKVHQDMRVMPLYALVVAKKGPKFQPSKVQGTTINSSRGQITVLGSDHTMSLLAETLGRYLDRMVVDKTGLDGRYELTLKWAPEDASEPASATSASDNGPSIFTAIQEQLGLRLRPEKGAVPVLVIDHIQAPSEN